MTTEDNKKRFESNVVFIGDKPFLNYVTSVAMLFTTQNFDDVVIKARGKFISRAVDVGEVAKHRFLENSVDVSDVKIGSEEVTNKEGRKVRVSFIEITLKKK